MDNVIRVILPNQSKPKPKLCQSLCKTNFYIPCKNIAKYQSEKGTWHCWIHRAQEKMGDE